jgi:lysyl-tRNA synthetase class 2
MSQQSDLNLKTYQPTCSIEALKARAKLYQTIRTFFAERDVLEVETNYFSGRGNRCAFGFSTCITPY